MAETHLSGVLFAMLKAVEEGQSQLLVVQVAVLPLVSETFCIVVVAEVIV
jgi:hypothetical protein